jgi:hypothetical protein
MIEVTAAGIAVGLATVKTGIETFRSALGLAKDVQGVLPPGEKKEAVAAVLAEAEKLTKVAEAEIAKALGYKLCDCAFPPTPMLKVGRVMKGRIRDVRECSLCKQNDAFPHSFVRLVLLADAGA